MENQENFIDEYWKGYEEFKKTHPDLPETKEIPCLNLIMKKSEALDILHGKKKIEFRAYSQHYYDRLYDKNVLAYIERHKGEEDVESEIGNYVYPLRVVRTIHFHNYNNTWHLDVEVDLNDTMALTNEDVGTLREQYGCTELDEELESLNNARETKRPMLFYFVIGKVIDTDLK